MVTQSAPPPRKGAPPPSGNQSAAPAKREVRISRGVVERPLKVVIYGSGGVGKSELIANARACGVKPLVIDLESGSHHCDVARVDDIETWSELRGVLQDDAIWSEFDCVAIDSLTKAEELAIAWTIANVRHEKGHSVNSIEGYGFGKGMTHAYETFIQLLGDLDALHRRGKHVVCAAHECTTNVPNPAGEDWIRWEPRLQSPPSGKSSIRHRVKEWADHLLYIGYDAVVSKDGKASGSGTRTIYPTELPTHWAKSRSLSDPIVYERGSAVLWELLLNRKA